MSLIETNLFEVVKKQYYYKLKAYTGLFVNMILIQAVALFFSAGGVGSSGIGANHISLTVKLFSADVVIIFTLIWAFIVPVYLTTKAYQDTDFAFVSNRLSSNLSNIAFLLTAIVVGGISANMSGYLIRVITLFYSGENLVGQNFLLMPQELLLSIIVTTLYALLLTTLGYFFGTLLQLHKALAVFLPVAIVGSFFVGARIGVQNHPLAAMVRFFVEENSFPLFALKIAAIVGLVFYATILLSNRKEVRQ